MRDRAHGRRRQWHGRARFERRRVSSVRAPAVMAAAAAVSAALGLWPPTAGAATDTWTGGSATTANWNDAGNWNGGTGNAPPQTGDALVFDTANRTTNTNDFTAGLNVAGI